MPPVFKDGSTEELSNYRPISVLLFFLRHFRNLYTVGYISIWMVVNLSIDINLALDHSIQLIHIYYQMPMNGIKTSTTLN